MVKKKTGRRKTGKKKTRKSTLKLKVDLLKAFAGITFLMLLVLSAGIVSRLIWPPKVPVVPVNKKPVASLNKKTATIRHTPVRQPTFEIYPEKEILPPKPIIKPRPAEPGKKPKIAIIIDDLGYDRALANKFLKLDAVLTFSVLPNSPHRIQIAKSAHKRGFETMLHLPMEPMGYPRADPGPGALLTTMPPDLLITRLTESLDAVPYIKGVNNHMGSKMTTVSTQMYQVFSILKKRDLFFIDSRTTSETLCKPSAHLLNLPFAQRDVFLDHTQNQAAIRQQLNRLTDIAGKQGTAVGIGHPHVITYEVLHDALPDLKKKFRLVPASDIVSVSG